jgi:PAS domain S-box-containing protein
LFKRNDAALAIVEPNGQFSAVNDAFSVLVGRGQAELVRKSWQSITHPDDVAPDADMVRACVDGDTEGYSLEKRYVTPSGDEVHVRIWVRSFRMYQRLACFVVHAQRLEGPSSVTQPAPVVMRPKMDLFDLLRDNPGKILTTIAAIIAFLANEKYEKIKLKESVDALQESERRRSVEQQKRSEIEQEMRLRSQFGNQYKNPEKQPPQ